jgi:membrane protein DedA with SNARE-associated domain
MMKSLISMDTTLLSTISLELLPTIITDYGFVAVLVSVFFLGEYAIIIAFILVQQGHLPFSDAVTASTIATLSADTFWFSVGRYFPVTYVPSKLQHYLLIPTNDFITRLIKNNFFVPIVLLRFFIGTRLVMILYLSRAAISWKRFLFYDLIGTVIYLLFFALLGIFLGELTEAFLPEFKLVGSILSGVLVIMIISIVMKNIMKKINTPTQL